MSWKRAQTHAESMLLDLGAPTPTKGRQDLRGRKLLLVDDRTNPYRSMCFSIAAKLAKRRGAEVETREPNAGEVSHAKLLQGSPASPNQRTRSDARGQTGRSGERRLGQLGSRSPPRPPN
jgi:hypothetical protein